MLENFTYTETTVINRELVPSDLQNTVELFDTNLTTREQAYRDAGYHVLINRYLKAFKVTIDINSILPLAIPGFNELATNLEINTKLRELEWKSPRKHLNLMIQTDGLNWKRKGIVSLLNRVDLPYYDADLMAFFTEGLAVELGEIAKIGVQVQDVGNGWITAQDNVVVYGNLVKEVTVINTSNNLEKIANLSLKDFGLSVLEKANASEIRTLLGLSVPVVIARRNTDLSYTSGTATEINYTVEDLDLFNSWDGTTFTVAEAGFYTLNFNCFLQATAGAVTANDHNLSLVVNGTSYTFQRSTSGSSSTHPISGSTTLFLNVGDTLKTRFTSTFTGATATKLGAATNPTILKIVKDK